MDIYMIYPVLLLITIITPFVIIGLVFRNKSRLVKLFILVLLCLSGWSFFTFFEILSPVYKPLIYEFSFIFRTAVSPLMLVFVLEFTGRTKLVNKKLIIALSLFYAAVIVLLLTNNYHKLFLNSISLVNLPYDTVVTESVKGPLFNAYLAYNYSLLIIACFILLDFIVNKKGSYKGGLIILLGLLMPFAANVLTNIFPDIFNVKLDLTVLFFMVTEILFLVAVSFFKLIPLSRNMVFDFIDDSIFILNDEDVVIDFNKNAKRMIDEKIINYNSDKITGVKINDLFGSINYKGENIIFSAKQKSYFIEQTPIFTNSEVIGKLLRIKDITYMQKIENLTKDKEISDLKDKFVLLMIHDLKQPLTPIIGFSELLKESANPKQKEYSDKILSNAYKLKDITEKVINSLKFTAETYEKTDEKNYLSEIVDGVLDSLETSIASHKVKILKKIDKIMISYDSSVFSKVLSKILEDLISASQAGNIVGIESSEDSKNIYVNIKFKINSTFINDLEFEIIKRKLSVINVIFELKDNEMIITLPKSGKA
ncbi:Uncharacterised protein [Candidatus Tiddalikarchaeum anstoanum]|nr:Uncharacterised protein [Candidatus Tiddalikarchaeum anstoanum]